ncbi:E3 binding domain-containing protein [uncultured Chloroflexus sp.]|uniref:E3 binding domain-containing protein n=1 Tax=uncultured Chloroflexus sp. TaxID=214040 RepID=UPI00262AF40B|nr:E3 binding domain-containing protein [uncultured Chloroflexus sp.]
MQQQTITLPPALGEATLLEWLVAVGDPITPATPVVRVLTADAEWVLPAQCDGILAEQLVAPGAQLAVGAILARCAPPRRLRVTPLARRMAAVLGVDLATLTGSGPAGRIGRDDVLAAAGKGEDSYHHQPVIMTAPAELLPPEPVVPIAEPSSMLADQTVAVATVIKPPLAITELIPLASATIAVNVQPLLRRCAAQAAEFAARGLQATPLGALIAAAAALFPLHPLINAVWSDSAIIVRHRYHVAAGLLDGRWSLVADAGDLTERGIARALAQANSDLSGATCVIAATNGWWQIVPPLSGTSAALTLSAAHPQPVALDEKTMVTGSIAHLSVWYDARILDHPTAMAFLRDLGRRLSVE